MSLQKPATEQELIERIVNDILHDYVIKGIEAMHHQNFTAYHRWLEIPFDDLGILYPDIHQGPEALHPQETDTELEASVRAYDLQRFLQDNVTTPSEIAAHYRGPNAAEVRRQFDKRFQPFIERLWKVIQDEFPELRIRLKKQSPLPVSADEKGASHEP